MLSLQVVIKCAWRVLSEYSGALGALISLAGILLEAFGLKAGTTPNWAIIAIGAALFFVTACKIELELVRERDKNRSPTPSVSLDALTKRLAGEGSPLHVPGLPQKIWDAHSAIRQEGRLGRLSIFGRPDAVAGNLDHTPLAPIPADFWEFAQIDYMEYLQDPRCKTEAAKHPGPRTHFSDLHFDAHQIDAIWPAKKRRRFRLQSPITREAAG